MSVVIETECAHCSEPMHIEMNDQLEYRVREEGADPVVFIPKVDFQALEDPSINDSLRNECVFFWSEEHAREYRKKKHRVRGEYFTATQMVKLTKLIQSALFGFDL